MLRKTVTVTRISNVYSEDLPSTDNLPKRGLRPKSPLKQSRWHRYSVLEPWRANVVTDCSRFLPSIDV
jgi:hypothetical protein